MRDVNPNDLIITPDTVIEEIDLDERAVTVGGRHYTNDDAEADAARIRAQARRGLTPGGTSLSGDGSHSPSVTVTLPREVRDAVRARAAAEGMSVSKYLRRMIETQIAA